MSFSYQWDWSVLARHFLVLLKGMSVTVQLTAVSVVAGTALGVVIGALTSLERNLIRRPIQFLVDLFKAVPLLILLLVVYYAMPSLLGRGVSAFTCAVIALSLNLAAFVADLVRGAVRSVPKQYVDAALALGMSRPTSFWRIELPLVSRQHLPALVLLWITTLKLSTLASVISVYEILHTADGVITNTFRTLEVYVGVAVFFVLVVMPLSYMARRLERSGWLKRRLSGAAIVRGRR